MLTPSIVLALRTDTISYKNNNNKKVGPERKEK